MRKINIGGGKQFNYRGWINFDELTGYTFTPDFVFPFADKSVKTIYSSHCLEHLDDDTVDQILRESRRILDDDGLLVLKIPDFDDVLKQYKTGNTAYFSLWGIDKVVPTWAKMGVKDSIDSRASMIFCGNWDKDYGHEFKGKRDMAGYHGPVPNIDFRSISNLSPHSIAKILKNAALPESHFNHQNAWSKIELECLLVNHGFKVISSNKFEIIGNMNIPTLHDLFPISLYMVAA